MYFFNLSCIITILGQFHGLSKKRTSLDSAAEIWNELHQKEAFHNSFYLGGNMSQTLSFQLKENFFAEQSKEGHQTEFLLAFNNQPHFCISYIFTTT